MLSAAFRLCFRKKAWGACKILNADGSEDTSVGSLGWANPIRYRGYYYDNSLGLYYLTTRYYDPETGRFTSADDSSYLAPNTVNGLNLYAYCGNNPVMNVDPEGYAWYEFWNWDWKSIGKIAAGIGGVAVFAVGSVFTGGTLSVVLAGSSIGGGLGFVSGGVSGVASGGGFSGFADGALSGTITGSLSGAVSTSPLGIGRQMIFNATLNASSYAVTQAFSGNRITLGGLVVNGASGAVVGYFGGHGWHSAAMAGKLLKIDTTLNLSNNFLRHSFTYIGKAGLTKMALANIGSGGVTGFYAGHITLPWNKRGDWFGY